MTTKDEGDELEGIEGDDSGAPDEGFGEYPLDELMIRSEVRTVHELLRRIDQGRVILDPDFQRAFVWDETRQSRLIESVLLRIPLPVMYLAENSDGKLVVVDGLQRLSTFRRFVSGGLALRLERSALKGKRFSQLEMKHQARVEDTQLVLYIIDSKVPEKVRLDIFERVNSGVALTRQQMRNCLYSGAATAWLKDCADLDAFTAHFTARNLEDVRKSMRDREIVNRWMAFRTLGVSSYRGDMDGYLGEALEKLNKASDAERKTLAAEFERGVTNNTLVFGKLAFRRHEPTQTRRGIFNVALFDAWCAGLAKYTKAQVVPKRQAIREAFFSLLADEEFRSAVSLSTNQRNHVTTRFTMVASALEEVLGAP